MNSNTSGHILTFDSDWCEDYILEYTLDMLDECKHAAVFFLTSRPSNTLMDRLLNRPRTEIGIHPNLLKNVPNRACEIITELVNQIPEASCARTHGLIWWPNLAREFRSHGIIIDSSSITPLYACKEKLNVHGVYRFPITMGDSYWMSQELRFEFLSERFPFKGSGICILNIHPIHVFCNTRTNEQWEQIKPLLEKRFEINRLHMDDGLKRQYGVRFFLGSILHSVSPQTTYTFRELLNSKLGDIQKNEIN